MKDPLSARRCMLRQPQEHPFAIAVPFDAVLNEFAPRKIATLTQEAMAEGQGDRSMTADRQRVLVTGSAGRIGQAAVRALKSRGHSVRGFDIVPTPGADDSSVGSVTEPELVRRAMSGCTALVHLAAT